KAWAPSRESESGRLRASGCAHSRGGTHGCTTNSCRKACISPRGMIVAGWNDGPRDRDGATRERYCGQSILEADGQPVRMEYRNLRDDSMSSMHRTIEGQVLVNHLTQDEMLIDTTLLAQHGRSARTLVKEGPLRVTVIALAANATLPAH